MKVIPEALGRCSSLVISIKISQTFAKQIFLSTEEKTDCSKKGRIERTR
jgi:hypothetical protein